MKNTFLHVIVFCSVILLMLPVTSSPQSTPNWTAYNDLAWGTNQLEGNISKITSPTGGSGYPSSGELRKFSNNSLTGVTLTIYGGEYVPGSPSYHANDGRETAVGDAAIFNGKISPKGAIAYYNAASPAGDLVLTFSGLNINKLYKIIFYADRNAYGWDRASLVTISGVDGFQNQSSIGIDNNSLPLFSGTSDPSTRLPSDNINGYVACFNNINPGSDCIFVLTVSFDGIVAQQYKGKYASALMVEEYDPAEVNWTAYNDFAWGAGQLYHNITRITSPTGGSGYPSSGKLVKYIDGSSTGITLNITGGSYNGVSEAGYGSAEPSGDAAQFNGNLSPKGAISYVIGECADLVLKFSGMNPNKLYNIVFYADRGDYGWNQAFLVSISNAVSYLNQSSSGSYNGRPLFYDVLDRHTWLPADNVNGYVARYNNVNVGSDSIVVLTISFDGNKTSNYNYKGKYASALMVEELNSSPATVSENQGEFTLIHLPDTQFYTGEVCCGTPAILDSQIVWIVRNKASKNIVYVAQVGDITEQGDVAGHGFEWVNAEKYYQLEKANIPYGLAVGGHDQRPKYTSSTVMYNTKFGVNRFQGREYYGGHWDAVDDTKNDNHFDTITVSGMDFIIVYLEHDDNATQHPATYDPIPRDRDEIAWADRVLKAYPEKRAIVVSHNILANNSYLYYYTNYDKTNPDQETKEDTGERILNGLKSNPNLFLTLSGHIDDSVKGKWYCEFRRTDTGGGGVIHSICADYQTRPHGGDGWLRIMEFDPPSNKIWVKTYSPWLNQYETDDSSQFWIDYDMSAVDGKFITNVNSSNYEVTLSAKKQNSNGNAKVLTFEFTYNSAALEFSATPLLGTDYFLLNGFNAYDTIKVSRPEAGRITIRLVEVDNPVSLSTNYLDIIKFKFSITNSTARGNLSWVKPRISKELRYPFYRVGNWENKDEPLPVELYSFIANVHQRNISLKWTTLSEINSYGFEVERKLGVESWEKIGFVKASGNSSSPKDYILTDKELKVGIYNYRLKMIDNDGTFTYSNSIDVEIGLPKEYTISQNYPNPFNPITRIAYQLPFDSKVTIELFGVTGEKVTTLITSELSAGYYTLDVDANKHNLASGVYICRMVAQDQSKKSLKAFMQNKKIMLIK